MLIHTLSGLDTTIAANIQPQIYLSLGELTKLSWIGTGMYESCLRLSRVFQYCVINSPSQSSTVLALTPSRLRHG